MAARKKPAGSTQQERDRISLGRIESYMDAVLQGEFQCPTCKQRTEIKEISSGAVALIRARYDKLRPSLSAVEQTTIDVTPAETDLLGQFRQLLQLNPELKADFLALLTAQDRPSDNAQGIH